MKYLLTILVAGIILFGCGKPSANGSHESKIVAMVGTDTRSDDPDPGYISDKSVIFTGNDIASFNTKTREITFRNLVPAPFAVPIHCRIDIYVDNERLFSCVHINGSDSAVYNDLVLFYDLGNQKYYLNDYYPFNWDPEGVKANIETRMAGWNKFLSQLKQEGKLKQ